MKVTAYHSSSGRRPVDDFIGRLPASDRAKFVEVITGIEASGLEYQGAEFKHLTGKLWEIKFRAEGGGYRIAYVVVNANLMIWLHAFRKTSQKTRKADLELALKRLKELL
jgi:phage-related protein